MSLSVDPLALPCFILLALFESTSVMTVLYSPPHVFLKFIFAFLFIFLHSYLLYIAAKMVQKTACKYQLGAHKVVLVIAVVLECRHACSHATLLLPLESKINIIMTFDVCTKIIC